MRLARTVSSSPVCQSVDIRIDGIEQAVARLTALEYRVCRRVVSAAVRAASAVAVKEARSRAPRRSGALAASIRGSVNLDRATGTVISTIASRSTKAQKRKGWDAYYAHMVIGGTKPHVIPSDHKAARHASHSGATKRRFAAIDGHVYSRVRHPGIKPNPFMEQAADAIAQQAIAAFAARFGEAVDDAVAKGAANG